MKLLSVGIDIGTTTTQLVFSNLLVRNEANAFSVPQFSITDRQILYRSKIHFTPLLSDSVIDANGVKQIVSAEYAAAGIDKGSVKTGAVIITGETARKENAREVLNALSGFAGDFVVATAGPALESILAGKGSGAAAFSEEQHCSVLNLDIGGGTTNLALFDCGRLVDTGCLNIGGRLMKFDKDHRCTYLSPVLQPYFTKESDPNEVSRFLAEVLEEAVGLRDGIRYQSFITDKLCKPADRFSFSGGVADLIDDVPRDPYAYGDLGVFLGKAIFRSRLCKEHFLRAQETIRATVIGAGSHTTELSGSTVFYDKAVFPIKNLPVAVLDPSLESSDPPQLAQHILSQLAIFPDCPAVLYLNGQQNPSFKELCKLAEGIASAFKEARQPFYVIAVMHDMAKALGQAIHAILPQISLICLDGVQLHDGAYLDIGAPIAGGQVLPIVIKTLVL